MATTRKTTGHSAPRKAYVPEIVSTTKAKVKRATKAKSKKPASGSGAAKPKANISKPRAKTGAGVTKTTKKAPATHHKRKPGVGDKVKGAAEKAVGSVEKKPAKKAAGTKKIKGTDGKGGTVTKKAA